MIHTKFNDFTNPHPINGFPPSVFIIYVYKDLIPNFKELTLSYTEIDSESFKSFKKNFQPIFLKNLHCLILRLQGNVSVFVHDV